MKVGIFVMKNIIIMKNLLKFIIIILICIPVFLTSILIITNGNLKYTEEIEIQKSITIVDRLFGDIYNMVKYMPTTKSVLLTKGADYVNGAEYQIIITMGEEEMEMKATLINYNLPDSITFIYEVPGVVNTVTQKHLFISENKTLIINEQEFQFSGLMKIIAFFEPKGFNIESFRKQSKIYLNSFKNFVENYTTTIYI